MAGTGQSESLIVQEAIVFQSAEYLVDDLSRGAAKEFASKLKATMIPPGQ